MRAQSALYRARATQSRAFSLTREHTPLCASAVTTATALISVPKDTMASKMKDRKKTPVSHKVIEKRRRDRINRCLNELGKTVPMALAKQNCGKLEKAEILEMTVQYLRALHSADFPRGREKGELLSEFANYFHYGYHECMKNLVHYLTTVERTETKDNKYARILAFLQSKVVSEPVFGSRYESAFTSPEPMDFLCQLRSPPECHQNPSEPVFQQSHSGHLSWHGSALAYPQQHGLDHHHYMNFMSHSHSLHTAPHVAL